MNVPARDEFQERIKVARIRPRIRRSLRYVPEEVTRAEDRDFIAVLDKPRHAGVLLFDEETVAFELSSRTAKPSGSIAAVICDFCATWRRGPESAVITFGKGDRRTVSFLVCADLDCSLHVRGLTDAGMLSRSQIKESISTEGRIERLRTRLSDIIMSLKL